MKSKEMTRDAMNPLAIWTYHRRHWRRTALLSGLICLATLGLYLIITLVLIMTLGPFQIDHHYLQNMSLVSPRGENDQVSAIMAQVRTHPDVAMVIPVQTRYIGINMLGGAYDFPLIGLAEADIATVMSRNGVTLKTGRLIRPRTSEFMLSEELAANLGLQVGDQIVRTLNEALYNDIREPMTLVGLLAGDTRLAIVSQEYLASHELYRARMNNGFLVFAQPGGDERVDQFLVNILGGETGQPFTLQMLLAQRVRQSRMVSAVLGPIALLIAFVVTIVSAVINHIEVMRRLAEFGILSVVGYSKGWLTRRLAAENTALALGGWALGIGLPWLVLVLLEKLVFAPRGYGFQPFYLSALLLTTPIPVASVLFTIWRVARTFARMDSIAVVEHGALELETTQHPAHKMGKGNIQSLPQPLSSYAFYSRHRRRAALLIAAMALMIMGVVALIFLFTAGQDALVVQLGGSTRMSALHTRTSAGLAPGVSAQVRAHPAVARVIPYFDFYYADMSIPPFSTLGIGAYAVSEDDMAYLVDLYGLQIKEGRLPRPRTNELIIAEATAANKQLQVGDILGHIDNPAYEGAPKLATPLEIVGIFARANSKGDENWLAFASLEYVQSHESIEDGGWGLLVAPKAGQKATLDDWLEQHIASSQIEVLTYRTGLARFQENERSTIRLITIVEGVVALVAAITLAVLNYIFLTQRQTEFGVLNALGYNRRWLAWRTLRETLFTTATAWALSVLLCGGALAYMHWVVYQPLGIPLNFSNPLPWLFTLPVPLAVLIASASSIRQMLFTLDPVAVIERS